MPRQKSAVLTPAEAKTAKANLKIQLKSLQTELGFVKTAKKADDKLFAEATKLHEKATKASDKKLGALAKEIEAIKARLV